MLDNHLLLRTGAVPIPSEIAMRLKISQPAACRCSKRGEHIEKANRFELIDRKGMQAFTLFTRQ
jgi:hypothetical protein